MTSSKHGYANRQQIGEFKSLKEADSKRPGSTNEGRSNTTRHARERSVIKTACLAPYIGCIALDVRVSPERFATSSANSTLVIPYKRDGQIIHYHAAGSGHRRRKGR